MRRISMWLSRLVPKLSAIDGKLAQQYSRAISKSVNAGSENRILKSSWGSSSALHRSIRSGLHPPPEYPDQWRQGFPDPPLRSNLEVGSRRELYSTYFYCSSRGRTSPSEVHK